MIGSLWQKPNSIATQWSHHFNPSLVAHRNADAWKRAYEEVKKKAERSPNMDSCPEEKIKDEKNNKNKSRSGTEKARKERRISLPITKYERLAMIAADAESREIEQLRVMAAQKPTLRMHIICGEDAFVWRERSAMKAADEEAHTHERNGMATRIKALADRLHWHESLRDTTQSLARAGLLQHQGLPSWIILEGMNMMGEAVLDRQIPADQAARTP